MHDIKICLLLILAILSADAYEPVQDTNRAIDLQVREPGDGEHDGRGFLQIKAEFDMSRTTMVHVNTLEFYLYPVGGDGNFQMFAIAENVMPGFSTRFGWQHVCPRTGSLNSPWLDEDVRMLGVFCDEANPLSVAQLHWQSESGGYCFTYKVVATGVDSAGNIKTIYRTKKVKADGGCNIVPSTLDIINALIEENDQCLAVAPVVQAQDNQITTLIEQAESSSVILSQITNNSNDLDSANARMVQFCQVINPALEMDQAEITRLTEKLDAIETRLFDKRIECISEFESLLNKVTKIKLLDIAYIVISNAEPGCVSEIFENSVYVVREREDDDVDITAMAAKCESINGILLELEDMPEQEFVGKFLEQKQKFGALTGLNDIEDEGTFSYYESGNSLGNVMWAPNEPANADSIDCVVVLATGLIRTVPCESPPSFVCEIPLL